MLPDQAMTQGELGANPAVSETVFFPIVSSVFFAFFRNTMEFPLGDATFAANGALPTTLPGTLTVCAGIAVPFTGNPACDSPAFITSTITTSQGTIPAVPTAWNGIMRYVKTANRFGGNAGDGQIINEITAWLNYLDVPGSVLVGSALVPAKLRPGPLQVPAGPGGRVDQANPFTYTTHGGSPLRFVLADITDSGRVLSSTPTELSLTEGASDITSLNGPWTTGRISISTSLLGNPDHWILSGIDARTENGSGLISMVSGHLTRRSGTGSESANPGVLTLQLPEPSLAIGLLAGVGMLAGLGRPKRG